MIFARVESSGIKARGMDLMTEFVNKDRISNHIDSYRAMVILPLYSLKRSDYYYVMWYTLAQQCISGNVLLGLNSQLVEVDISEYWNIPQGIS